MDKNLLVEYGIDYERGLVNCMEDAEFFQTLLTMFLQDDCFARAREAYADRDYHALFSCMHELKGVSGNAALSDLYAAIVPLVQLLRGGTEDHAEVDRLFAAAETAYTRACDGIVLALAK